MPVAAIDLSRLPAPDALEALDYEAMVSGFLERFLVRWEAMRERDPTLPEYDMEDLETDPAVILGEAWSILRTLDRARVNDAIRAVLAPLAKGADLDAIAARVNIVRLVVTPATATADAVMESDARLLRRYLLAFARPSAGTSDRYLLEALTAWPQMLDGAVIGRAVHGRRGESDLVVIGPDGRAPTAEELSTVRAAVTASDVKPEAVAVNVLAATRRLFEVAMHLRIPAGPDAAAVEQEAEARVRKAAAERMVVGGEVPRGLVEGAAYGLSIVHVALAAPPADIAADPYGVPVLSAVTVTSEVAQ